MRSLRRLIPPLALLLLPLAAIAATSPLEGRWRLDKARSTAIDGWSAWDLVISTAGSQVSLRYEMQWYATKVSATNTVDTAKPATVQDFFRVDQRHMAVYPIKGQSTPVQAAWIDGGRTLRVEAEPTLETSQGNAVMRIYSEYRLVEGDHELLLIELHSSRPRPLIYRFTKVTEGQ